MPDTFFCPLKCSAVAEKYCSAGPVRCEKNKIKLVKNKICCMLKRQKGKHYGKTSLLQGKSSSDGK